MRRWKFYLFSFAEIVQAYHVGINHVDMNRSIYDEIRTALIDGKRMLSAKKRFRVRLRLDYVCVS